MWKAGLIGAGANFLLALLVTLLFPICNPCVALFIGFGAGMLAAFWERPATQGIGATRGAEAGAVAAAGGLIGQMIGAVLNGIIVGPEGAVRFAQTLGLPADPTTFSPEMYWITLLAGNCCCALFGVALGAGLGALGGLLGHQIWGPKEPSPASG